MLADILEMLAALIAMTSLALFEMGFWKMSVDISEKIRYVGRHFSQLTIREKFNMLVDLESWIN